MQEEVWRYQRKEDMVFGHWLILQYIPGEPTALAMVAARQKISLNYLEQVFGQLRKGWTVRSIKGPARISACKPAKDITVKEILEVLEGPFSIVGEIWTEAAGCHAAGDQEPGVGWRSTPDQMSSWRSVQLEHLVNEYKSYQESQDMMYYIWYF